MKGRPSGACAARAGHSKGASCVEQRPRRFARGATSRRGGSSAGCRRQRLRRRQRRGASAAEVKSERVLTRNKEDAKKQPSRKITAATARARRPGGDEAGAVQGSRAVLAGVNQVTTVGYCSARVTLARLPPPPLGESPATTVFSLFKCMHASRETPQKGGAQANSGSLFFLKIGGVHAKKFRALRARRGGCTH